MTSSTFHHVYNTEVSKRFGGESIYEMILFDFCSAMKEDRKLLPFYGSFDIPSLVHLQRETLDWAFGKFESEEERRKELNRIKLHHYRLREQGLSGKQGRVVVNHFLTALREAWSDESLIHDVAKELEDLAYIYGYMGFDLDDSIISNDGPGGIHAESTTDHSSSPHRSLKERLGGFLRQAHSPRSSKDKVSIS